MKSIIVVDKEKSLEDIVRIIRRKSPQRKVYRAHSFKRAMDQVYQKYPSAILIDEAVENSDSICLLIKMHSELSEITQINYFVEDKFRVKHGVIPADYWYVKGSYDPKEVYNKLKKA